MLYTFYYNIITITFITASHLFHFLTSSARAFSRSISASLYSQSAILHWVTPPTFWNRAGTTRWRRRQHPSLIQISPHAHFPTMMALGEVF